MSEEEKYNYKMEVVSTTQEGSNDNDNIISNDTINNNNQNDENDANNLIEIYNELKKESEEEPPKNSKIVYPANLYSSLSFNWLYDVIQNRTEDKPVKINSLGEISPSIQSKHFFDEIMLQWNDKYHKKLKTKKDGFSLFVTLLQTNKERLIISLILFLVKSISEFFCVLTFKEILMRYKDSQKLHKTILNSFSLLQLVIFMLLINVPH